jgi:diguanylate cyclase (GGDEF)-like protein
LIARNELLETILLETALLVERQEPGYHCAVIRREDQSIRIAAALDFPARLLERLRATDLATVAEPGDSCLDQLIAAVGLSREPAPAEDPCSFRFIPIRNQAGDVGGWLAITHTPDHHPPPLFPVMTRAAALAAIAFDHASLYEKLSFQAGHDALTEVPNRLLFQERLQQAIMLARRDGRIFAVCMLDLDRFKQANDLYGQRSGDSLLRQAAHRISSCLRPGDTVARLGGDEFAIILDNLSSTEDAKPIASSILASLEQRFSIFEQQVAVTGSLGYSVCPQDGSDAAALVRNANAALSRSKSHGRNVFHPYDRSMGLMALEGIEIERHLRAAPERGEFEVYYQLQFDVHQRVCGMEALVRWHSPVLGPVSPGKFIPIAEDSGLIVEIGQFVLRRACQQAIAWQRSGLPPVRIAVNVSIAIGPARICADRCRGTGGNRARSSHLGA